MLCLSVRQPWAHAIAHLGKDAENRTWRPHFAALGRPLAIHASRTRNYDYEREATEGILHLTGHNLSRTYLTYGAIVAVTTLSCHTTEFSGLSPWATGPVAWLLEGTVALPHPIPLTGRQRLFRLDSDTTSAIYAQIAKLP